jgi:hypothetical protein
VVLQGAFLTTSGVYGFNIGAGVTANSAKNATVNTGNKTLIVVAVQDNIVIGRAASGNYMRNDYADSSCYYFGTWPFNGPIEGQHYIHTNAGAPQPVNYRNPALPLNTPPVTYRYTINAGGAFQNYNNAASWAEPPATPYMFHTLDAGSYGGVVMRLGDVNITNARHFYWGFRTRVSNQYP